MAERGRVENVRGRECVRGREEMIAAVLRLSVGLLQQVLMTVPIH